MPAQQDNRGIAVAAGIGLLAAGGTIWYLSRSKAGSRPPRPRGVIAVFGLPTLSVLTLEAGIISVIGLPTLAVLTLEAGKVSEVDVPSLAVLV